MKVRREFGGNLCRRPEPARNSLGMKIRPGYGGDLRRAASAVNKGPQAARKLTEFVELSSGWRAIYNKYLFDIKKYPLLTPDEERELFERIEKAKALNIRDNEAEEKLITSNLLFVVSVAKRYAGGSSVILDFIDEGNKGLIRAIERFDYRKGFRFMTYAVDRIRQAIRFYIHNNLRTIRLPLDKSVLAVKVNYIANRLLEKYRREPTIEEIANEAIMSEDEVKKILNFPAVSYLESPKGHNKDGEEKRVGDYVPDRTVPPPDRAAIKSLLRKDLDEVMKFRPDNEKKVIYLFFGLDGILDRTLDDVGEILSLTRERVRQIKSKALKRLERCHPELKKYL